MRYRCAVNIATSIITFTQMNIHNSNESCVAISSNRFGCRNLPKMINTKTIDDISKSFARKKLTSIELQLIENYAEIWYLIMYIHISSYPSR